MVLFSDLTGSTGSEAAENERSERGEEEEEGEKRPAPHMLLQLALGKELARSNRWQLLDIKSSPIMGAPIPAPNVKVSTKCIFN